MCAVFPRNAYLPFPGFMVFFTLVSVITDGCAFSCLTDTQASKPCGKQHFYLDFHRVHPFPYRTCPTSFSFASNGPCSFFINVWERPRVSEARHATPMAMCSMATAYSFVHKRVSVQRWKFCSSYHTVALARLLFITNTTICY